MLAIIGGCLGIAFSFLVGVFNIGGSAFNWLFSVGDAGEGKARASHHAGTSLLAMFVAVLAFALLAGIGVAVRGRWKRD